MDKDWTIGLSLDTSAFDTALSMLEQSAEGFGATLTGALKAAVISGRSLEDTLLSIGRAMSGRALDLALRPLDGLFENAIGGLFGGLMSGSPQAMAQAPLAALPALGAIGSGRAISALDASASSQSAKPTSAVNVNVSINTPDAESFRRSQAQISALLARSVSRGTRHL